MSLISNQKSKNNNSLKDIIKKFKKDLISKYNKNDFNYNRIIGNYLIINEKCEAVVVYKDYLILNEETEFLRRYYSKEESHPRLSKILFFYENYSQIFPNYLVLPESKFLYTNIRRKQKMIDAVNNIKNEEEINKNNIKNNPNDIFTKQVKDDIQKCQASSIIYYDDDSFLNSISVYSKKFMQTPDGSLTLDLTKNINEINDTNGSIENILNDLKGINKNKLNKKSIKKSKKIDNKININNNYNKPSINISKPNSTIQKVLSSNYNINKKGSLTIYNNYQNIIIPKENTVININNNYYQYPTQSEDKKNFKTINTTKKISKTSKIKDSNSISNTQINNKVKKLKNISQRSTEKKPQYKLKIEDDIEIIKREYSPKTTRNTNKLFKSPSKRYLRNKKCNIEKSETFLKTSQTFKKLSYNPNPNRLYKAIFLNGKNKKKTIDYSKSSISNNTISVKKIEKKSSKIPSSNLNSSNKKLYENEKSKILNTETPKKLLLNKNVPWTELKQKYKQYVRKENNITVNASKRNSCDNFLFLTRSQKDFFKDKFGYQNLKKSNNNKRPLKENNSAKDFSLNYQKSVPSTKNTSVITESKDNNSEGKGNNHLTIKVNRQSYLAKLKKKFEENNLKSKNEIHAFQKLSLNINNKP